MGVVNNGWNFEFWENGSWFVIENHSLEQRQQHPPLPIITETISKHLKTKNKSQQQRHQQQQPTVNRTASANQQGPRNT